MVTSAGTFNIRSQLDDYDEFWELVETLFCRFLFNVSTDLGALQRGFIKADHANFIQKFYKDRKKRIW